MITLQQLYESCLELGIKSGPRAKKEIEEILKELKKQYEKMDEKEKKYFDLESLKNPFLDSRIEWGDPDTKLKRILVGIDVGVGEMLLANEFSKNGTRIDAVIAHHPEGRALISLTKVMDIQQDISAEEGVPINIAEKLIGKRIGDLDRALHPVNHFQVPDAARLLGIPFACFHTFADNQVYNFIKNHFSKKNPRNLGDMMESIMEIPEFQNAKKKGNGPVLFAGDMKSKVGKISFSGYTGGTSGSKDIYEKMAVAGIGTLMVMHIPEEHRKLAEQFHMNIICTGHMASDSIGVNILMDEAEKKGVEIIPFGGFDRVSRVKKGFFKK